MGDHKLLFSKVEKWVRKQPVDRIFMSRDVSVDLNLTASSAGNPLKGMDNVEKVGVGWRKVSEAKRIWPGSTVNFLTHGLRRLLSVSKIWRNLKIRSMRGDQA